MFQRQPQPNVPRRSALVRNPTRFWLALICTGAGAGLAGGLLMKLLHLVQHVAWSYDSGTFLEAVRSSSGDRRIIVLLVAGAIAAIGAVALREIPSTHGGGIAASIWFHAGRLNPLRSVFSAVSSICVVGMGASLGREGALKQAGAVIASELANWTGLTPAERRLLVACGAGAGIGAAYNVPFGGALFALEVLLGTLNMALVVPAVVASFIGTVVSWALLPDRPTYHVSGYELTWGQIVWSLPAGPLLGIAAVVYVRLIAWADGLKRQGWIRGVSPFVVFLCLGLLSLVLPEILGNGKDTVQLAFDGNLGIWVLVAVSFVKPLASAGCLGCGAPGGLFTPTLTYGSALGGLLGWIWELIWPGATPGSYALIGAGVVLAAASQGPLCAVVLLIELTRHVDTLMVPLLIALAGATLIAPTLEPRSIYTARIRRGESMAIAVARRLRSDLASQVCSSAARYPEVAERLLHQARSGGELYLVDESGRLQGEITLQSEAAARVSAVPLEASAAIDFAVDTPRVEDASDRNELRHMLDQTSRESLPVVDKNSGALTNVITRNELDSRIP